MTDRHCGYVVTLADDLREDDAEAVITALRMVRGVVDVRPVVADAMQMVATARVDHAWRLRLSEIVRQGPGYPDGDGK